MPSTRLPRAYRSPWSTQHGHERSPPALLSFRLQACLSSPPFNYSTTPWMSPRITSTRLRPWYFKHIGHHCSTFDVAVAELWQSNTRAIRLDYNTDMHVLLLQHSPPVVVGAPDGRRLLWQLLRPSGCLCPVWQGHDGKAHRCHEVMG
ncbi:hypothetical protein B296_00040208 [Ensete ventricosum]|uniref:Uncharacterized protein n=1 Tax=Ensete ventricosum TaxID=4639 RepID=A0A426YHG9_ENSVE|nr:hypothetical protein B296_00040208 [Ensete ventricosum]